MHCPLFQVQLWVSACSARVTINKHSYSLHPSGLMPMQYG